MNPHLRHALLTLHALPRVWALSLSLVLLLSAHARAQSTPAFADPEYLITRWQTEDGLPENSATAMIQDRDGYLWFGTFHGLVRFDGVTFRVFNRTNTPGLPHNGIHNLHLDRDGRIWVSTLGGLVVHDHDSWTRMGPTERWSGQLVRSFAERSSGEMLLTTLPGLIVQVSGTTGRVLPTPESSDPKAGYWGFVDEVGHWWVAQPGMVAEWDGQRWTKRADLPPMLPDRLGAAASRGGGFWVVARNELRKFRNGSEVSSLRLSDEAGGIWHAFEDSVGSVWVSTYDQGLCRIDPSGKLRRWTIDNGLDANSVRFVFEDRERNIWIGTSGGGLTRFTPRRFKSFGRAEGIHVPNVNAVAPGAEGRTWVATYGAGLYRIDHGVVTHPPFTDKRPIVYLQSVLEDRAGRVWVGSYLDGLFRSDDLGQTWTRIDPAKTSGANPISLFQDSRDRVWVCGGGGLAVFEGDTSRVFTPADGLPVRGFHTLVEDSTGAIWTSDSNNVYRLIGERFEQLTDEIGGSIKGVAGMLARPDGSVWMGGPVLRQWKDGRLKSLPPTAGLGDLEIFGFVEDAEGFCWMLTDRGIVRARTADLEASLSGSAERVRAQVFDRSDGLLTTDSTGFRQPVCGRDASGVLWFATGKGVESINPATLRLNELPPPIRFESVTYQTDSGESVESHAAELGPGVIRLPPGSRRIEIRYTALSLTTPGKVRFESKLSDIDRSWHSLGTRRTVRYEALRPGTYSLNLRAMNNDGRWSDEPAVLSFEITPFVWQTLWFRGVVVLMLVAVTGLGVWLLTHAHARRARERLELRQHRSELIHLARVNTLGELSGALAHELSQPLTAILTNAQAAQRFLGQQPADITEVGEILTDIVKENRRAGEIINRLRHLLKKGEVNWQPLDLGEVLDDVLAIVHSDLISRNISVVADLAPGLGKVRADRVQLQQVLLNLINNAAEAMAGGPSDVHAIVVRGRATPDGFVQVSVVDTGPGFPSDRVSQVFEPFFTTKASGMGLGLCICRTIVSAHGGRIWAQNNPDRGASVHFLLPTLHEPNTPGGTA